MKSLISCREQEKIELQDVKAGQMFIYGHSKFIRDNYGYFVNLTCGLRVGFANFPFNYRTSVTLINSCYCFRK